MILINKNKTDLINTIKLLIYKENPTILEKIDFENDAIFLEPLLFAYFNSQKDNLFTKTMLTEIMQGYFLEKEPLYLNESYNKNGIAYVPNLGYFDKEKQKVEDVCLIPNTNIELIKYPLPLLKHIYKDFNEKNIEESKIENSQDLVQQYVLPLTNAYNHIRISCNNHYNLIEQNCKKICLFKTNPKNTNSFATINAHGIAFLNVYQDDYNEAFFVDDIAHQTGHIIMTNLLFDKKEYFLIDEKQNINIATNVKREYRSFYILFHALYTYYTTLLCLDSCLDYNCFVEQQRFEALGRIGFYLLKFKNDLENINKFFNFYDKKENVITSKGIIIYEMIENKYFEIQSKYEKIIQNFDYYNQPYNFSFREFSKINFFKNV